MPLTESPYPILSHFLCAVENVTGMPPQPLDATPEQAAEAGQPPKSVTLEVTPQQAITVASAARQGTLSLSLHSTNDTSNTCTEIALKPAEKIRIIRGDGTQATLQQGR